MASTTQQQPDRKPSVFWLEKNKASDKKDGWSKNAHTLEMCQQVSNQPEFSGFIQMEIWNHMHTSRADPRVHITARVKTTEQKESNEYQTVHVYTSTDCMIDPKVKHD